AYGAGTPLSVGAFEQAELVTSVCGAFGTGRIFSGGTLQERADLLSAFGNTNHSADVAFIATQAELNSEVARQLAASPGLPVQGAIVTGSVNLSVRQVALRNGCFAVLGATR